MQRSRYFKLLKLKFFCRRKRTVNVAICQLTDLEAIEQRALQTEFRRQSLLAQICTSIHKIHHYTPNLSKLSKRLSTANAEDIASTGNNESYYNREVVFDEAMARAAIVKLVTKSRLCKDDAIVDNDMLPDLDSFANDFIPNRHRASVYLEHEEMTSHNTLSKSDGQTQSNDRTIPTTIIQELRL